MDRLEFQRNETEYHGGKSHTLCGMRLDLVSLLLYLVSILYILVQVWLHESKTKNSVQKKRKEKLWYGKWEYGLGDHNQKGEPVI